MRGAWLIKGVLRMKTVVSLFDKTGVMVEPWIVSGYTAVIVDIQHQKGIHPDGNLIRIGADLKTWVPPRWLVQSDVVFLSAFPPCDHLAVSGARWFAGKGLGALADAVTLFDRAAFWADYFEAPYCIENPVSTMSTYWRKPDHVFSPHHYAGLAPQDNYTKKTCLWTGNDFVMPPRQPLIGAGEPDDRIHKAPPGDGRKDFRSATAAGFAEAVFKANWTKAQVLTTKKVMGQTKTSLQLEAIANSCKGGK